MISPPLSLSSPSAQSGRRAPARPAQLRRHIYAPALARGTGPSPSGEQRIITARVYKAPSVETIGMDTFRHGPRTPFTSSRRGAHTPPPTPRDSPRRSRLSSRPAAHSASRRCRWPRRICRSKQAYRSSLALSFPKLR